jgi:multidrug transporter EmrE-like cation transporter
MPLFDTTPEGDVLGVITIIIGSLAFSVGGAFMGHSAGFTRLWPSVIVAACFVIGSGFLARAVHRGGLSTTYVLGLGFEAVISVAIGLVLFGERLSGAQITGIAIILVGLATLKHG